MLKRTLNLLAARDGFALVLSIGTSMVLGISGTSAMLYTTANHGTAVRSSADQRALSLAEAGLADAYATLYNASNPTQPDAVPHRTLTLEDGTVTYYGTLNTAKDTWTLVGVGTLANPVRGASVVRTARGRVHLGTGSVGSANNAIWNYVYAEAPTSCTTLPNSVVVNVPFYIKGDLCLQNSAQVAGSSTVLQVGGTVTVNNMSTVGTVEAPLAEAHIAGGCRIGNGTLHSPCGPADRVHALKVDMNVSGLVKPAVDLAAWYRDAQPGPMHGCTTGSFPGGFDNDTTMNRSLPAAVDITPALPYDCQVHDAQGGLLGRIAWTPGAPGTLMIAGTIFFDGDIEFRNQSAAVYQGRATIYASGKITLRNLTTLCGVASCDAAWEPTQNLLAFVAGTSTDDLGFTAENNSVFQGAVYCVNDYSEGNSATIWGPIVARQIFFQNSTTNHYVPLGTILPGMPADYDEVVTLANDPGSWG